MKFTNEQVYIPENTKIEVMTTGNSTACTFQGYQKFKTASKEDRYNNYKFICYYPLSGEVLKILSPGTTVKISGYDKHNKKGDKVYYNYIVESLEIVEESFLGD